MPPKKELQEKLDWLQKRNEVLEVDVKHLDRLAGKLKSILEENGIDLNLYEEELENDSSYIDSKRKRKKIY